jgi:hypothetical protein
MWLKWLPWKYIIRYVARKKGFIDPIVLFARFSAFSQPAQTAAPVELLRAGAVLHARGFINNHVIQHNLDWVWPLWVERQFNPRHPAFIPRAFAMTHINLTQRNWTAVGYPGGPEAPVVDGRGLVMPFFDSFSLDGWFVPDEGEAILPSRLEGTPEVMQRLETEGNLRVVTTSGAGGSRLIVTAAAVVEEGLPVCRVTLEVAAAKSGWLAASARPYNAEGVSFVNEISVLPESAGWEIDKERRVLFGRKPDAQVLSRYLDGDAYSFIRNARKRRDERVVCEVGMATSAALYRVEAGDSASASFTIPLYPLRKPPAPVAYAPEEKWRESLVQSAVFTGGPGRFRFLYDAAVRTAVLLSPAEVFAGSYTYKRFWYRDAAIIIHAMMAVGHRSLAERALDFCITRQTMTGYFLSQEGEWDSNGQVLWALGRYCRLFNVAPKPEWIAATRKAVHWIRRKRGAEAPETPHRGLMPAGFSAEHLGPNDYYYWDDFWTLSGLRFGAEMLRAAGDFDTAGVAEREWGRLSLAVNQSLAGVAKKLGTPAMPASPYRRLDSGAVGSVAVGFPLQLWPARDPRLMGTLDYLCDECSVDGAFYHDISHAGINPYLTLEIAQCLLRAGDARFDGLMRSIARLASPTGQWPEAIHPQLATGCMGDGQHAWAAAEWILMMRNCFFFEEEFEHVLILGAGLSPDWCEASGEASFGPAPTRFGPVRAALTRHGDTLELTWSGEWFGTPPKIDVRFAGPGITPLEQGDGQARFRYRKEDA